MKIIDVHSHWGTERGYPLQTPAERAQQKATWNSQVKYHSETEMAQYFRDSNVQAHIWFLKSLPSRIGLLLDMTLKDRPTAPGKHRARPADKPVKARCGTAGKPTT